MRASRLDPLELNDDTDWGGTLRQDLRSRGWDSEMGDLPHMKESCQAMGKDAILEFGLWNAGVWVSMTRSSIINGLTPVSGGWVARC